jgi:hypothetical protein
VAVAVTVAVTVAVAVAVTVVAVAVAVAVVLQPRRCGSLLTGNTCGSCRRTTAQLSDSGPLPTSRQVALAVAVGLAVAVALAPLPRSHRRTSQPPP